MEREQGRSVRCAPSGAHRPAPGSDELAPPAGAVSTRHGGEGLAVLRDGDPPQAVEPGGAVGTVRTEHASNASRHDIRGAGRVRETYCPRSGPSAAPVPGPLPEPLAGLRTPAHAPAVVRRVLTNEECPPTPHGCQQCGPAGPSPRPRRPAGAREASTRTEPPVRGARRHVPSPVPDVGAGLARQAQGRPCSRPRGGRGRSPGTPGSRWAVPPPGPRRGGDGRGGERPAGSPCGGNDMSAAKLPSGSLWVALAHTGAATPDVVPQRRGVAPRAPARRSAPPSPGWGAFVMSGRRRVRRPPGAPPDVASHLAVVPLPRRPWRP
jgi:hypothetical protein